VPHKHRRHETVYSGHDDVALLDRQQRRRLAELLLRSPGRPAPPPAPPPPPPPIRQGYVLLWDRLCDANSRLSRFQEEAVEAGSNGWADWPHWVKGFSGFTAGLHAASAQLRLPFTDCFDAAISYLGDLHRQHFVQRRP